MHIEFRHLRTIQAIHEAGSLAGAADLLGLTQSALSHQIRGIEEQAGVELFVRATRPLRLSPAGLRLLAAAQAILPQVAALEAEFANLEAGRAGRMHVAIECHACFEWLLPVMNGFRKAWPEVDIDIRPGLAFDALPALRREEVDLVVSSDPEDLPGVTFHPLFDYQPVLVTAADHPLAAKPVVEAADFAGQTLIAYPVDRARLDAFTELLAPEGVEPAALRPVELTAMILLLVASGRGIAVLPDWVVRSTARADMDIATRPLERRGRPIVKRLFAATRSADGTRPYVAHLIRLARQEAVKLQRG
ncbi:LysR family transcriptional regulator [Rubellimicrobium aerolatum]|uniref:HTH-type transcriptional regulator MetR n=1 Tax=Rubellimicrobium aerolatum TaxID=490979 RepID=A0ABW0SCH7_9RHOB|nr:LysR family transcriptional regulator [Rubellimicrobium aerolatum]MBP1806228.1 LysR family transcriptional regulator for metE and metH [Rubellimicrobium aerolatum]